MDVFIARSGELHIKVELAAMQKEDLQIEAQDNRIRISGSRPDEDRVRGVTYLLAQLDCGPFECVIDVPRAFDCRAAHAKYSNGFLRILVSPKQ